MMESTGSYGEQATEDNHGKVLFDPPLYRQRYSTVKNVLQKFNVYSVLEFGCAECKSVQTFKNMPQLNELICVDLDNDALDIGHKFAKPLSSEYLFAQRERPLTVTLMKGDLCCYDERFSHAQAVVMIEVIEHLLEDVVEKMKQSVFAAYKPELVVMTTPNSEFNVLFENFSGFRHPDHKFEWTRQQFEDWCHETARCYGYSVSFDGVGEPPARREEVGCCSQLAVFERITSAPAASASEPPSVALTSSYHELYRFVYPAKRVQTTAQRVQAELPALFRHLRRLQEDELSVLEEEVSTASKQVFVTNTDDLYVSLDYLISSPEISPLVDDVTELKRCLLDSDMIDLTDVYVIERAYDNFMSEEEDATDSDNNNDVYLAGPRRLVEVLSPFGDADDDTSRDYFRRHYAPHEGFRPGSFSSTVTRMLQMNDAPVKSWVLEGEDDDEETWD